MHPTAQLSPLRTSDFAALQALAKAIWHEHYSSLLSQAQIDYMLLGKYTPEDLAPFLESTDRWFDVLRVDAELSGFVRCLRDGSTQFKLSEIYLSKACRGKGLGQLLLGRAQALAEASGCTSIILYVNRRNTQAVEAYERVGYVVKRECNFDIGEGYVMDDYLMQKSLSPQ
ncbi:MAG: ribosomal protein S18 acetylase RimI-like enzyme [Halioglobus sp.]|jgi:ribosomal protein S18 acetylase RimI-like enzyme